jgi:hypothetical protein
MWVCHQRHYCDVSKECHAQAFTSALDWNCHFVDPGTIELFVCNRLSGNEVAK